MLYVVINSLSMITDDKLDNLSIKCKYVARQAPRLQDDIVSKLIIRVVYEYDGK